MRKKNRTLGTRLTEKAKDLFTENYKTSLKEMKGRVNKGKATSGSWVGELYAVKTSKHPKKPTASMHSLQIPVQILQKWKNPS